jgi:two-component system response regulator (stage 0 sporulation protein F)
MGVETEFDAFLAGAQESLRPGSRVLVVDDEEFIRYTVRRILEKKGFHVTTTSDGAAALRLMEQRAPDLVLLDLKMPGMSGDRVLKKIRDRWARLPVIILTGCPESHLVDEAAAFSPTMFLSKVVPHHRMGEAVWPELVEAASDRARG